MCISYEIREKKKAAEKACLLTSERGRSTGDIKNSKVDTLEIGRLYSAHPLSK
jgi:hypothetical protein